MKSITKKICLPILEVLCLIALSISIIGCNNQEKHIELKNFEDIEIMADLGSIYTLPICNVEDKNGNNYRVYYEITTKSGKTINVFNNSFCLKYFEDYIVLCKVNLGNGQVNQRIITIKTQDTVAPVITFGKTKNGMVNRVYHLPEIKVEDSSQEVLTASCKVFYLNGTEKSSELTVIEDYFVPRTMGYYLIEATAVDSHGNIGKEEAIIFVRETPKSNEIISFDYEQDIDNVGWAQKNGEITWLDAFEGENGVAKFSYLGNKWSNSFAVLPLQSVSNNSALYMNYNTLIVRMYIKNDAEFTNYFVEKGGINLVINKNTDGNEKIIEKAYHSKTVIQYNQWVNYEFSIEALSAWDIEALDVYTNRLWGYGVTKYEEDGVTEKMHKGEFYIASIFCSNK